MSRITTNYDLPRPQYQPQAAPVDRFGSPEVRPPNQNNNLAQLASALSSFNSSFAKVASQVQETRNEEERKKAMAEVMKLRLSNQEEFKKAIEEGRIKPMDTPWALVGYDQAIGAVAAEKASNELFDKYQQSGLQNENGTAGVEKFAKEHFAPLLEGRSQYELEAMVPRVNESTNKLLQAHSQFRSEERQKEMVLAISTEVGEIAKKGKAGKLTEQEFTASIQRIVAEKGAFLPRTVLNTELASAAKAAAIDIGEPDLYEEILARVPTTGGKTLADSNKFVNQEIKDGISESIVRRSHIASERRDADIKADIGKAEDWMWGSDIGKSINDRSFTTKYTEESLSTLPNPDPKNINPAAWDVIRSRLVARYRDLTDRSYATQQKERADESYQKTKENDEATKRLNNILTTTDLSTNEKEQAELKKFLTENPTFDPQRAQIVFHNAYSNQRLRESDDTYIRTLDQWLLEENFDYNSAVEGLGNLYEQKLITEEDRAYYSKAFRNRQSGLSKEIFDQHGEFRSTLSTLTAVANASSLPFKLNAIPGLRPEHVEEEWNTIIETNAAQFVRRYNNLPPEEQTPKVAKELLAEMEEKTLKQFAAIGEVLGTGKAPQAATTQPSEQTQQPLLQRPNEQQAKAIEENKAKVGETVIGLTRVAKEFTTYKDQVLNLKKTVKVDGVKIMESDIVGRTNSSGFHLFSDDSSNDVGNSFRQALYSLDDVSAPDASGEYNTTVINSQNERVLRLGQALRNRRQQILSDLPVLQTRSTEIINKAQQEKKLSKNQYMDAVRPAYLAGEWVELTRAVGFSVDEVAEASVHTPEAPYRMMLFVSDADLATNGKAVAAKLKIPPAKLNDFFTSQFSLIAERDKWLNQSKPPRPVVVNTEWSAIR